MTSYPEIRVWVPYRIVVQNTYMKSWRYLGGDFKEIAKMRDCARRFIAEELTKFVPEEHREEMLEDFPKPEECKLTDEQKENIRKVLENELVQTLKWLIAPIVASYIDDEKEGRELILSYASNAISYTAEVLNGKVMPIKVNLGKILERGS